MWKCCSAVVLLIVLGVTTSFAQDKADPKKPEVPAPAATLKSVKDKVSYGIGLNIGRNLAQQKMDLDVAILARGIADMLANRKPALTQEELQAAFEQFHEEMAAKNKLIGEKNKADGQKFLDANGKKQGIKSTKSGLQYQVLRSGNGPTPKATDVVATHYKGRLIDGSVFDGSYEGDQPTAKDTPVEFPVNGVIKGWTEALQLMKVGDKWRLFIPSNLAYDETGTQDGSIGPNSVLVFDIELVAIKAK